MFWKGRGYWMILRGLGRRGEVVQVVWGTDHIGKSGHWGVRVVLQLRGDFEDSGYSAMVHDLPLAVRLEDYACRQHCSTARYQEAHRESGRRRTDHPRW